MFFKSIVTYVACGGIVATVYRLGTVPLVRRIEYLEAYLVGVAKGLSQKEIEEALVEAKKSFEYKKNAALGRGVFQGKRRFKVFYLARHCFRLSRDLGFITLEDGAVSISDLGVFFLEASEPDRVRLLCEVYSRTYPHLYVLVDVLLKFGGLVEIPMSRERFKEKAEALELPMSQVVLEAVRDMATYLGLVNWSISGSGDKRVQRIYLSCQCFKSPTKPYRARLWTGQDWLYCCESTIDKDVFKDVLWRSYLELTDGVPGSPVVYYQIRDEVCHRLRLRDDQFDSEVMRLMEDDEFLVQGSEGSLVYGRELSGRWKSLPPKNPWGDYIVFLRISKR